MPRVLIVDDASVGTRYRNFGQNRPDAAGPDTLVVCETRRMHEDAVLRAQVYELCLMCGLHVLFDDRKKLVSGLGIFILVVRANPARFPHDPGVERIGQPRVVWQEELSTASQRDGVVTIGGPGGLRGASTGDSSNRICPSHMLAGCIELRFDLEPQGFAIVRARIQRFDSGAGDVARVAFYDVQLVVRVVDR